MYVSNGSTEIPWELLKAKLWKCYYANAGRKGLCCAPFNRVALLRRSVEPLLMYHIVGWPFTRTRAKQVNSLQMAMLSRFIKLHPVPGEAIADFIARKSMLASKLIKYEQKWAVIWAERTNNWHNHIVRHPDHLCTNLLSFRPQEWLRGRRNMFTCDSLSLTPGGRTDTRASRGKPCQRFETGCEEARLFVAGL